MESIKNDKLDNKLRWELLPLPLLELVVKVFHFGAEKYGPDRWQNLPDGLRRYVGCHVKAPRSFRERRDNRQGERPSAPRPHGVECFGCPLLWDN